MASSISTGCFALSSAIAKTSVSLNTFVRDVRESRAELEALSGELYSLDGVLDLLRDDAESFPRTLAARTPTVLQHCIAVVNELEGYLTILNSNELSRQAKKFRWTATKSHLAKLRLTLDGYKSTLGLALDLVAFTKDSATDSLTQDSTNRNDLSRTVSEMGRLSTRLQGDFQKNAALRSYLDALKLYAETTGLNLDSDNAASTSSMKSVSDAPDSAIEMNDETPFETSQEQTIPIEDIEELLDELKEMPSNQPPVPPPRDIRRSLSRSGSLNSPTTERPFLVSAQSDCTFGGPARLEQPILRPNQNDYTFVTTITGGTVSEAAEPPPPIKRSFLTRMFSSKKRTQSSVSIPTIDSRPSTTSTTVSDSRPPSASEGRPDGLIRRNSRRMSSTFKSFPMFKVVEETSDIDNEPNAVFGVSLQKSLSVARGTARAHHTTSKGKTSSREFPLCIHKCVQFIISGTEEGVHVPDVFGETGDSRRLAALRSLFSEGPTYGEDVDWAWFTVYEAADLILLFLSELPKPLVSESVAKKWISLSRQATVSNGSRTDQCLDFWDEALSGVRGPARNLLKLLLNLWADVAEAADHNGMTAERLAGRIVQPLMQTAGKTYTTDYMLAVAFLIRKRAEYLAMMGGKKGKAKAAF